MRAPVLIGGVGGPVGIELLLWAPAGLKQPLGAVARDRASFALALGLQRAAALAQPRPPTLRPRDELLRFELRSRRAARPRHRRRRCPARARAGGASWPRATLVGGPRGCAGARAVRRRDQGRRARPRVRRSRPPHAKSPARSACSRGWRSSTRIWALAL